MANLRGGDNYTNITTATTTVVKSGGGVLKSIVINTAVANGVIAIYDNTAASGTLIGTITLPAVVLDSQYAIPYGVRFSTGLTIVTTGTPNLTVVWN
jgi:hypothetical protein